MPRLALAALLLSLTAVGCTTTQTPQPDARVRTPDAGEPFRLALGDTADRDGHSVRFAEVVEDSRCPEGVQCVSAGRAQIRVEIDGDPFVLTVPHAGQRDTEASMVEWGEIQVVLTGLEPYPGVATAQAVATPVAVLITRPSTA